MIAIWNDPDSAPYPRCLDIDDIMRGRIRTVVDDASSNIRTLAYLARTGPLVFLWSCLDALGVSYGLEDNRVYEPLGQRFALDLDDPAMREEIKNCVARACTRLGLPVRGRQPTDLFFPLVGVSDAYLPRLAKAFVAASRRLGPPAIEDSAAAASWQRAAVAGRLGGLSRVHVALEADDAGWHASVFSAWIRSARVGRAARPLLEAIDEAARAAQLRREELVRPPRLLWKGSGLAMIAFRGAHSQRLVSPSGKMIGLEPGKAIPLPKPWPGMASWYHGERAIDLPLAPGETEALAFDAEDGAFIARLDATEDRVTLPRRFALLVASRPFLCAGIRSADHGSCHAALLDPGDLIPDDATLEMPAQSNGMALSAALRFDETSGLEIEAPVIGRSGADRLYAGEGRLVVRLPAPGQRLLRMEIEGREPRFASLVTDPAGRGEVALHELGLAQPDDPARVRLSVLAVGASRERRSRAERSVEAFVWPGACAGEGSAFEASVVPGNLVPERSRGVMVTPRGFLADPDEPDPVAGLVIDGEERVFALRTPGIRLWHVRRAQGDRVPLRRMSRLALTHDNRHDGIAVQAGRRRDDLIVRGRRIRRPFLVSRTVTIPAGLVTGTAGEDLEPVEGAPRDRILLEDEDGGRAPLLVIADHLLGAGVRAVGDGGALRVKITSREAIDAVHVGMCGVDGVRREYAIQLGRRPVEFAQPPLLAEPAVDALGTRLCLSFPSGRAGTTGFWPATGRLCLSLRREGEDVYERLRGVHGQPADLAVDSGPVAVAGGHAALGRASAMLAEPAAEETASIVESILAPFCEELIDRVGALDFIVRLGPVFDPPVPDGAIARNDLLRPGLLPLWERPLLSLSPLGAWAAGSACPATLSASLGGCARLSPGKTLPDPSQEEDLVRWVDGLASGGGEDNIDRDRLIGAMRALLARLGDGPLGVALAEPRAAEAARLLLETHAVAAPAFDRLIGRAAPDRTPGRIAAYLSRFALATRRASTAIFLDGVARRTGLLPEEVSRTTTLMLRGGVELLGCFLALWDHSLFRHDRMAGGSRTVTDRS